MKHAVMMTLAVLMLAGCTERSERAIFDGNYYPPKTRAEKEDRRNFTASVRRASRGIEGAQSTARRILALLGGNMREVWQHSHWQLAVGLPAGKQVWAASEHEHKRASTNAIEHKCNRARTQASTNASELERKRA